MREQQTGQTHRVVKCVPRYRCGCPAARLWKNTRVRTNQFTSRQPILPGVAKTCGWRSSWGHRLTNSHHGWCSSSLCVAESAGRHGGCLTSVAIPIRMLRARSAHLHNILFNNEQNLLRIDARTQTV